MTDAIDPRAAAEAALEQAAARAVGAQPEEIKLPAEIARGIVLFEMSDGSFGAQPLPASGSMTIDESLTLAVRYVLRSVADMSANSTVRLLQATQAKAAEAVQAGSILRALRRK